MNRTLPWLLMAEIILTLCRFVSALREKSLESGTRCGKMESMEYIDLRKVGSEGLKEIRRQVVRLKE
jgi:hypothetical protein